MRKSLECIPTLVLAVALLSAEANAQTCSTLPNLFIVQDRSGSMTQSPDPTNCPYCASKWSVAKSAMSNMTSQYSGQFKFGLGLYPSTSSTSSCATGGTAAPIGTPPATINTIYSQTSPYGGTPTAASLEATRSYLQSQGLTAPTYVLLVTDGMPNCNPSNTSALDDAATRTAAANLKNAGFKVYVVGFGSGTTGNNKAVLDGIAAAGGTSTAYSASDQTSLSNALSAIAGQISTCCTNACTLGATQCTASGQRQSCVQQANGCSAWTTENCPAGNTCRNGSCQTCTNACTAGAQKCEDRTTYQCVKPASNCTVWEPANQCQQGQACGANSCQSCVACTEGATRCSGNTAELCAKDTFGCTKWQPTETCQGFCSGGSCGSCGQSCTIGEKRCNGDTVETCATDANGCSAFAVTESCAADKACGSGQCLAKCTVGELSNCEQPGYLCEPTATGGVCVKDPNAVTTDPDAGTSGGGGGETLGTTSTPGASTNGKANTGSAESFDAVSSGCTASGGSTLLMLALLALRRLARRRAP